MAHCIKLSILVAFVLVGTVSCSPQQAVEVERFPDLVISNGDISQLDEVNLTLLTEFDSKCTDNSDHSCLQQYDSEQEKQLVAALSAACVAEDAKSCGWLTHGTFIWLNRDENNAQSAKFATIGCDGNDPQSCHISGYALVSGDTAKQNTQLGLKQLHKSCGMGIAQACMDIANCRLIVDCKGIQKSEATAFAYYKEACVLGHESGCFNIANMYKIGEGTPQNSEKAAELFLNACNQGNRHHACVAVALMMINGDGIDVDSVTGAQILEDACEVDWIEACMILADLYFDGAQLPKNEEKAANLYLRVCNQYGGNMTTCTQLGYMHEYGLGVDLSLETALDFYYKACISEYGDKGDPTGCENQKRLANQLSNR